MAIAADILNGFSPDASHFDKIIVNAEDFLPTAIPRIRRKDITPEIQRVVAFSAIREGFVAVQTLHTTTALIGNENEEGLAHDDIPRLLQKLCPEDRYVHDREERLRSLLHEPANGVSHLRSVAASGNPSVILVVHNHTLELGTYQAILLYDLDPHGRPCRNVIVQVIGIK